jgi:hypothetical protein
MITPNTWFLGLFADDTCIHMLSTAKNVMFSESCSEVSILLKRGARAGTKNQLRKNSKSLRLILH